MATSAIAAAAAATRAAASTPSSSSSSYAAHAARCPRHPRRHPTRIQASDDDKNLPKLYIPGDALGGESPELKAAQTLRRLFTHVAIRVVQSHLEGAGNDGGFAPQVTGRDGQVMCPDYDDFRRAMETIPLGDGDEWLDAFMKINSTVALRVIIARETYAKQFDYGLAKTYAEALVEKGNAQLMKRHASRSFSGGDGQ